MEVNQFDDRIHMPWEPTTQPVPHKRPMLSNLRRPTATLSRQVSNVSVSIERHRILLLDRLPLDVKNHLVAVASEFAGTFMFLLFAFGGTNTVNSAPLDGRSPNLAANPAELQYIALCFGMSLAVNAWTFFRISGGLFNPAVTLGMMLVGAISYFRGLLIFIGQIAGAIAASAVVWGLHGSLKVATTLTPEISVARGLFLEMFLTAQLVFTIFMLAAEKHRATFIAPVGIGLSLFIAELMGVYYTGGSLNPARSFGPCAVTGDFPGYHWIYWVGPILGSLLASGFYIVIKALEYETVNPGQDSGEKAIKNGVGGLGTIHSVPINQKEADGQHSAGGGGNTTGSVPGSRGPGDQPNAGHLQLTRSRTQSTGGQGLSRQNSAVNRGNVAAAREMYHVGPAMETGRIIPGRGVEVDE